MVEEVIYGKGEAEVLSVELRLKGGGNRSFVVVYVPPRTNSWAEDIYRRKLEDTMNCLKGLIKNKEKILIMGDFNCQEVTWETWTTEGNEESRGIEWWTGLWITYAVGR